MFVLDIPVVSTLNDDFILAGIVDIQSLEHSQFTIVQRGVGKGFLKAFLSNQPEGSHQALPLSKDKKKITLIN